MKQLSIGKQPIRVRVEEIEDDLMSGRVESVDVSSEIQNVLDNNIIYREDDNLVFDSGRNIVKIHQSNLTLENVDWDEIPQEASGSVVTYRFSEEAAEDWGLENTVITERREDVRLEIDVANSVRWDDDLEDFDYVSVWRVHGIGMFDPDVESILTEDSPDDYRWVASLGLYIEDGTVTFSGCTIQDTDFSFEFEVPEEDVRVVGYANGDAPEEPATLDLFR